MTTCVHRLGQGGLCKECYDKACAWCTRCKAYGPARSFTWCCKEPTLILNTDFSDDRYHTFRAAPETSPQTLNQAA